MSTTQAPEQTYDEFELAVLQAHLDVYWALPECTILTCFALIHRGKHEEACWKLAARGMMKVTRYDGEVKETIPDDPKHSQYPTAISKRHERWTHPHSKQRLITYV